MTNEEAISIIKNAFSWYEDNARESEDEDWSGQHEALDLAIQALEQQPSEDCVSRSELQKTMDSLPLFRFVNNDHEEADDYYNCESVDMVIRNLPSVTPRTNLAETSQDCISREEVQDLISRWLSDYLLDVTREALETINYKVGDMPPVTPERPKGKWMECGGDEPWLKGYRCLLCNFTTTQKYDYCTCGAEMGGGEDEEDKEG